MFPLEISGVLSPIPSLYVASPSVVALTAARAAPPRDELDPRWQATELLREAAFRAASERP